MVDEDLAVPVGLAEAVGRGVQLLVVAHRLEAERVEVGMEMAAHAEGADQHDRAHAVARRLLELASETARPSGLGSALILSPTAFSTWPQLPSRAEITSPLAAIGQFGVFQVAPRAFCSTTALSS